MKNIFIALIILPFLAQSQKPILVPIGAGTLVKRDTANGIVTVSPLVFTPGGSSRVDTFSCPTCGTGTTSLTSTYIGYGNGSNAVTGSSNLTYSGTNVNIFNNGIGSTITEGLSLKNTTAAANNAQQQSGGISWEGRGWDLSLSKSVKFIADVLPIQGGGNPTAKWRLSYSLNGAAPTVVFQMNEQGSITCGASGAASVNCGTLISANAIANSTVNGLTQVSAGNNSGTARTFRTTNAGSDVTPYLYAGVSGTTAGAVNMGYDNTNQLGFYIANGTRAIMRAGIKVTSSSNTAGSEDGQLDFYTQSGGTAASKVLSILSGGGLDFPTTGTPTPASGHAIIWFDGTNFKVTKNVGGTTTSSTIF